MTDGVIAKQTDLDYRFGERAMLKVKRIRTADCVVGGFRYAQGSELVGSLLLALNDDKGLLDHVGFTSAFAKEDRKALTARLEKLVGPPGFGRCSGRTKPMGDRTFDGMAAPEDQVCRGGQFRPCHERKVSAWDATAALAPG